LHLAASSKDLIDKYSDWGLFRVSIMAGSSS
jgi:hypothetical protein